MLLYTLIWTFNLQSLKIKKCNLWSFIIANIIALCVCANIEILRDSASSFHWLSSSIFTVRSFVCPASVTPLLISTINWRNFTVLTEFHSFDRISQFDRILQFWQNFTVLTEFQNFDRISPFWQNLQLWFFLQFWQHFRILSKFHNVDKISQNWKIEKFAD